MGISEKTLNAETADQYYELNVHDIRTYSAKAFLYSIERINPFLTKIHKKTQASVKTFLRN